jgi:zinc protease
MDPMKQNRRVKRHMDMDMTTGAALFLVVATVGFGQAARQAGENVTRATLPNGLRVVIVQDHLAPVVTVQENYLAGGDETPMGFPGLAHAQEHMAFRGCAGLTSDQIAAIYAQLGGQNNADTQQNITQYFATLPAANLDVALHLDSACMRDIQDSQAQWDQERGAIEQEVARDLSNPTYKFITRLNRDMFAGTPYEHDALGTRESFDATTAPMLRKFFEQRYAPNNAILVITGDVNPAATLQTVRRLYGSIPKRTVPPRPEVQLQPMHAESFTLESNLAYTLVFVAYRMPGTDAIKDFAAANVLSDVLGSERANLYALVPEGQALATEFAIEETYPKASVAFAAAAIPAAADSSALIAKMKSIVADYVAKGVPAELVEAAKRSEVATAEFRRNSIPGLARDWSQALAAEGRNSPDEDIDAIRRVTVGDVNRVAKAYLQNDQAVVATLQPAPSGAPVASKGFGDSEKLTAAPSQAVALPDWAESELKSLTIPKNDLHPADMTLSNGIRLIVQTEHISHTVTLLGQIKNDPNLEEPSGKDGASDLLGELFPYGTKTLDRLAFRKALDDIAARESGGATFSLRVLTQYFPRAVELLAENELSPALPANAFAVVKQQIGQLAAGRLNTPEYRAQRALETGLLPEGDPELRETTPETVGSVSLDDVKNYYATAFRPDLTTIVVIGDVTAEEAKVQIEKYFGSWRGAGQKPDVTLPLVAANQASATAVPDPSSIQDSVVLAEELPMNRFHPDYYALQLGNHVLGGGFYATRLYRDLRQTAGLVYNVDDSLTASKTRATYDVTYACDPDNVSKARALVVRDLIAMQQENVTPAELQQAKALLLRQIPLAEASSDAVAQGMLARADLDLPLDEAFRAAERYYALTAEEVRAAFAKWIRTPDFVQVVRGPAPK